MDVSSPAMTCTTSSPAYIWSCWTGQPPDAFVSRHVLYSRHSGVRVLLCHTRNRVDLQFPMLSEWFVPDVVQREVIRFVDELVQRAFVVMLSGVRFVVSAAQETLMDWWTECRRRVITETTVCEITVKHESSLNDTYMWQHYQPRWGESMLVLRRHMNGSNTLLRPADASANLSLILMLVSLIVGAVSEHRGDISAEFKCTHIAPRTTSHNTGPFVTELGVDEIAENYACVLNPRRKRTLDGEEVGVPDITFKAAPEVIVQIF